MRTAPSPTRSRQRSTIAVLSPSSSPTLPLPLPPSHPISTLCPPGLTNHSQWASPPGCASASPRTRSSSPFTPFPSPSSQKTRKNSSPAFRNRFSTRRTYGSSPPDISIPICNRGRAKPPPPLSFPSTQATSQQWEAPSVCSRAQGRLSWHTPPIGTRSVRTAGVSAMLPLGAPPLTQSAPSAP